MAATVMSAGVDGRRGRPAPSGRWRLRTRLAAGLLAIVAIAGLLVAIQPSTPALAAGLPTVSWQRSDGHNGSCTYTARLSKPLAGIRLDAMEKIAQHTRVTYVDTQHAVLLTKSDLQCAHAAGGSGSAAGHVETPRRILLPQVARTAIGAIAGVIVGGTIALLLPEVLPAAAAVFGVTLSPTTIGVIAGCLGSGIGAGLGALLKGDTRGEIGVLSAIGCLGGAAVGALKGIEAAKAFIKWTYGRLGGLHGGLATAHTVDETITAGTESVFQSARSSFSELGSAHLAGMHTPPQAAILMVGQLQITGSHP